MENAEKSMEDPSNPSVRQVSTQQQQQEQHPKLQSPSRCSSCRETETQPPAVQAVSPQQPPSWDQPVVVESTPSFLGSSPALTISSDQIKLENGKVYRAPFGFICWCRKVFMQLPVFVRHLQQHNETTWCLLCENNMLTLQQLNRHLDLHLKVGMAHLCVFCRLPFLDQNTRRRHIEKKQCRFLKP